MLAVVYIAMGAGPQRLVFHNNDITIGSAAGCDVRMRGAGVAPLHARIQVMERQILLVPLSSEGVRIAGVPCAYPAQLQPHDPVQIGEYTLYVESSAYAVVLDPDEDDYGTDERMAIAEVTAAVEAELLDAIVRRDDGARLVYADWLEEQEDAVRAEFIRLELAGPYAGPPRPGEADDEYPDLTLARRESEYAARLRELAQVTDMAWRVLVARPAIERCMVTACPRSWSALAATDQADVRICETCTRRVHYCAATVEMTRHEGPVCVDAVNQRSPQINLLRSP
ncbi:MAG: TIGR02996 domain-containing protein [Kofleriaceae bacterium]